MRNCKNKKLILSFLILREHERSLPYISFDFEEVIYFKINIFKKLFFIFELTQRWGTSSGQNETSTYKRRVGVSTNGVNETTKPNGLPNPLNLTPPASNSELSKAPSPTLNNKDPLGHLKTKLIEADSSNRR